MTDEIFKIIKQKKENLLSKYKNKQISFYHEKKKHLSIYNIKDNVDNFKKMHALLQQDSTFIDNIEMKINKKNKDTIKEIKETKERIRRQYLEEWKRVKKYRNKTFLDTQSDYCPTVKTNDSKIRYIHDGEDQAMQYFKNFIILRHRVINSIPLKEYTKLKDDHFIEIIFNMQPSDAFKITGSNIEQVKFLEDSIRELYTKISNSYYCKSILHRRQLTSFCFNFIEFLYFKTTVGNPNRYYVTRYYSGQPEFMNLFCNIINKLLHHTRFIKKEKNISLEDIFYYLDVYVPSETTLLDILEDFDSYMDYIKHFLKYIDIFNVLYGLTYNSYIKAAKKLVYQFELNDLRIIIHNELVKFFEDKII
jgi:hypothetical protein